MDINELETYRLSDAVKFHDQLNPKIWAADEQMLPVVRQKLLAMAEDFRESLGIDLEVKDITISGSNAAYTYTPSSDIDLHLVADLPRADLSAVYRELFDAKKYQYNDSHDFRIGGYDVELYVQDARQEHVSQGIYSVAEDRWIRVPSRRRPTVDDISVKSKYEDIGQRVEQAIGSGDLARMAAMAAKIGDMRRAGLADTGEFGVENLAFKVLRNNGTLARLRDARQAAKNKAMSLEERGRKKTKVKTRYAYGGYFFPGYGYYGNNSTDTAADSGGDGGGGGESVHESTESQQDVIQRFARSSTDFLGMQRQPSIRLRQDPAWSQRNSTFGRYDADAHSIELATTGRHMVDILRTLAHEMTHARQNEVTGLPANAGATGSEYEDSANAMAGRIMRHWAESEPQLFQDVDLAEASGYIPTEKERNDPRFSMALTRDIRPGETGRQANKLGLKTNSQGRPALLMKRLNRMLEAVKLDEKCWDGYRREGMKKKGSRMVPNCVRVSEDEELLEVEMNPGAYQRFLRSADAEGIRAGFEAELIFRDTENDPDDRESGEFEPDYDQDQRPFSIDDVINFFTSGDDPMSQRAARQLSDEMSEQFMEWAQEQFDNDYFDQDRFMTWADDMIWPKMDDEYRRQARANLGDDATEQDIEQAAVRLFRDEVQQDWDRSGMLTDQGREELFNDYFGDLDQSDWFDSEGLSNMQYVANQYSIESWPHMTYVEPDDRGGSREWDDIATSMSGATGVQVRVSQSYKSTERGDYYVLEPDSSLTPDEPEDFGLEVVSPPLPLAQAIEQLKRVMSWANSSRGDAYTNRSTGLHMGVSLPVKGGDVDPIKLILFLGDKQLLELFGRKSNSYARSAYDRLRDKIKGMRNAGPQQISGLMDLMKLNLIELANRDLRAGVLGDKYVSVHPQQGYIEFRGPGGDYLSKENEIDGVLENTMLKLAYVMSIAGRDDLYRKEYAKKLYKMLTQDAPESPFMRLFAEYSAGTLSGEELKSQWADTVLAAEQPNNDEGVPINPSLQDEYEVFDRSTGTPDDGSSFKVLQTFRANSGQEAVDRAKNTWGRMQGLDFGVRRKDTQAAAEKPKSRRAELAKRVTRSTQDVGEQLWRVSLNSQLQYVMARTQAQAVQQAVQNNRVFNKRETRARIATNTEQQLYQLDQRRQQQDSDQDAGDIRATLGAPQAAGAPIPGSTLDIQRQRQQAAQQSQDEGTGRWEIRDAQGREIHTFGGVGNSQLDANRFAAGWVGQVRPDLAGTEVEVVPVMR